MLYAAGSSATISASCLAGRVPTDGAELNGAVLPCPRPRPLAQYSAVSESLESDMPMKFNGLAPHRPRTLAIKCVALISSPSLSSNMCMSSTVRFSAGSSSVSQPTRNGETISAFTCSSMQSSNVSGTYNSS